MANLLRKWFGVVFALIMTGPLWAMLSPPAYAVPSFGHQTGMTCAACHTVVPEFTAFGRQFKLRGYTLGNQLDDKPFPANLPLSASLIASRTDVNNTGGTTRRWTSSATIGWIVEVNYLPLKDVQNLKLGLRHTWYRKFNGASTNYNGFGRNAADNDATFVYGWLLF